MDKGDPEFKGDEKVTDTKEKPTDQPDQARVPIRIINLRPTRRPGDILW